MRILIAGASGVSDALTCDSDTPEISAFRRLNIELGRQIGERGHTLLLGSARSRTADAYALRGLVDLAHKELGREFQVEFHLREEHDLELPSVPANIHVVKRRHTENANDRRLGARVASVAAADGVICIAGGRGTNMIDTFAQISNKRIVGLPQFGGAGHEIFQRVKHSLTPNQRVALSVSLDDDASCHTVATTTVDLLESGAAELEKPFSYFISYSQREAHIADHFEVWLNRFGRFVLRDEKQIAPGDDLDSRIKDVIKEADSFLSLYSHAYRASPYCMGELEFARKQKDMHGIPARILDFPVDNIDDSEIPLLLFGYLFLRADSRDRRELAVRKIVDSENTERPYSPLRNG